MSGGDEMDSEHRSTYYRFDIEFRVEPVLIAAEPTQAQIKLGQLLARKHGLLSINQEAP